MSSTSPSSGRNPSPETRGHRKLGVVDNPILLGTKPDPEDPRNRVLEVDGYRELAQFKLPRAYFQEITDDDYEIGEVEYDLPQNRFQCHLLHSLYNISPVLHLLGALLRKHDLWPSNWENLPPVEELIKAAGITWNGKLEFKFDWKAGNEWTPASRYEYKLKKEEDLHIDDQWGQCDESEVLIATLEAFREAFKFPVDEANPVVPRLKTALSRDKDDGADSTQQADPDTGKTGLDVNESVKTMLADHDGSPKIPDDDDGLR